MAQWRRTVWLSAATCSVMGAVSPLAHAQAPGTPRDTVGANAPAAPKPTITPPTVKTHVDAEYPPTALADRKHADVVVTITVDVDGHVSKVDIAESGGADLDQAAELAVRQWTFVPAMRDGKAVASRIRVPFHFAPPAADPEIVDTTTPNQLDTQRAVPPAQKAAVPTVPATSATAATTATTPPTPATAPADTGVEDVTVKGRVEARTHGTSDYKIDVGALAVVPRKNASDLLKLAPGILLTNEGGEGHAEQVFLRGFDAREGQDLEFTVDGVPFNDAGNLHGNGYADSHFIIPELVESLRVVEGTYAPQQGNFAVAGSADYHLGLEKRGLTAKYTTGSFGSERLLLTWGPNDSGTGTFGGAEYSTTNGFGQNRQAKRATAMGQYEGTFGGGTYRVTAQAYETEYNSAGVMREDDYDSGRKGFYDTEDFNQSGNTSSRYSLSLAYERTKGDTSFTQQFFIIDRSMRLRENFTGFLVDVQEPTQSLHDQRGDLLDLHFNELTLGARGSARWKGTALGLPQEFEIGYFARGDDTASTQDRIQASNNAPYQRDVDLASTLGDVGLYADGNVKVLPWLAFRGGVRADMFLFDVLNNCAVQSTPDFPSKTNPEIDQSCFSEQEHGVYREPVQRYTTGSGAIMPRATVLIGPFDGFNFTGSYGEGVRSVDPIYVSQSTDTPFVSTQSREVGMSYARHLKDVSLSAKSVFFDTHVDKDLIFNETEGRNTLSTGSTRVGWAGTARATGAFFDEGLNLTFVRARFDDTHEDVPYVPTVVLRSDTAFFHELPWRLAGQRILGVAGLGVSYVGPRALPYGQTSDSIFVSDGSATLRWSVWEVGFQAMNLFDSKYRLGEYNYASDFHTRPEPSLVPARAFTAGAPRELFFSISATLGGPS